MAYVSCEIPSRRLPRTEPNTIEAIHVELLLSEHIWLLMANYHPPSQSRKSYRENAVKALGSAINNFENVILGRKQRPSKAPYMNGKLRKEDYLIENT